jgi:multidrug efflux pump
MLSSRLLKKRDKHSWFYEKTEPFYVWLNEKYNNALAAFMKVRWVSFLIIGGMGIGIYFLFTAIPTELAPIEDRGEIRINVTGPEGATYEYMERVMDELDRELTEMIPESERVGLISMTSPSYGSASTNTGNIRLILTDASERTRSQQEIFEQVSGILRNKTSVRAFASQAQSIGDRRGGLPVQYVVQAQTLDKLKDVIPEFMDEVNRSPIFDFGDINLKFTKPEIEVEIDRNKARNIGVCSGNSQDTPIVLFRPAVRFLHYEW